MPEGRAYGLPKGVPLPAFVGASGGATNTPGLHASVVYGDLIIGVIQDTADNRLTLAGSGTGYVEVARVFNGVEYHDCAMVVVAGFYRGQTLTFSGAGNHNLTATWAFRRVRAWSLVQSPTATGASSFASSGNLGTSNPDEIIVAVASNGEASPSLSSFVVTNMPWAERFGFYNTAVGRQGSLYAFGGRKRKAGLYSPVSWVMSGSSDMAGVILRLTA